jgi:hypothetical protein
MPAPTVTTHRVGKNSQVSINDGEVIVLGGNVRKGGNVDTAVYPDGFPRRSPTHREASGNLRVLVEHGDSTSIEDGSYITLVITDGTNLVFDGIAHVDTVNDSFANDGGWDYNFDWSNHGPFNEAAEEGGGGGGGGGGG